MTDSYELKRISKEGVPAALQKAERYRIINDPSSAESICLDVLQVDPGNQEALVTLLLAITDQLVDGPAEGTRRAQELLPRLGDEYKRMYYAGIIAERCAKAHLRRGRWGRARWRTIGSGRRWSGTRGRRPAAPPEPTSRSCAGTPAPASWRGMRISGPGSRSR